jgi:hypothetical protein
MLRNIGTEPLGLLGDFKELGYGFRLLDYERKILREVEMQDLLKECDKNGYGDLFLER